MKEVGPKGAIVIVGRQELQEADLKFRANLLSRAPDATLDELGRDVAEYHFRRPIPIAGKIALRPFWRDSREAPNLPLEESGDPHLHADW